MNWKYLGAAALVLGVTSVYGADNPLIGSWKFTNTTIQSGSAGCPSAFVFREKTATITHPRSNLFPAGAVQNMAVTYVPSPTVVFVMTNAAGHVNYNFTDAQHMYTESAWGKCNYERTN